MSRSSPAYRLASRVNRSSRVYQFARHAYLAAPPALNPLFWLSQLHARQRLRRADGTLRLHLGCGHRRLEGFLNVDMKLTNATDFVSDITALGCPASSVDRIETYHVIEHIPHPEVTRALREWYRVLRPGGTLVLECPDFDEGVRQYLAGDEGRLTSIYGLQRYEGDTHFFGYNLERLSRLLVSIGFGSVKGAEPEDYHKDTEPCLRVEAIK